MSDTRNRPSLSACRECGYRSRRLLALCHQCGNEMTSTTPRVSRRTERHFWDGAIPCSLGCLVWQRCRDRHGYGTARIYPPGAAGIVMTAHRVAWTYTYGEIPAGMHVLHRCDNPPCIRPDHLFLGTNADNARDRKEKGRTVNISKINAAQVRTVLEERMLGLSLSALARRHGISESQIQRICARKSWPNLPPATQADLSRPVGPTAESHGGG